MSPFFDELEGQLRSAAQDVAGAQNAARAPRPRRRRRWLPAGLDLAPVLASIVVVLVVGAALVLLGRGGHQPSPPASPPPNAGLAALLAKTPHKQLRREFTYISAATKHVLASKVCQVQQPTGLSFVHRTPDRELLSLLGGLRRPATPADRLSNNEVFDGIPDVYAGSIRRAFSRGGESYYLAVSGSDPAASVPSDRCFTLEEQALVRYLPKIPQALRAPTTELQTGSIAWARDVLAHGPRDAICLVDVGRIDNGADCGITSAQIKGGMTPSNDQGVFIGIVPDRVATVTLSWPAAHGRAARSVTGPAVGNVYAIRVPSAPEPPAEPAITWRSAQRRVLKTIPVATPAMERAACQKDPIPCALFQYGGVSSTSSASSPTSTVPPTTSVQAEPAPRKAH